MENLPSKDSFLPSLKALQAYDIIYFCVGLLLIRFIVGVAYAFTMYQSPLTICHFWRIFGVKTAFFITSVTHKNSLVFVMR
jgi:hypothetical protein